MEEYPGNSFINEEKRPGRVVSGVVSQRKTPILDQIVHSDTARSIWQYIVWDVLVPAVKNTLSDIVTNSLDMALFGSDSRGKRSNRLRRSNDRTFVSYSEYYGQRTGRQFESSERRIGKGRHRFDEIIFETRDDAETLLGTLVEMIDQYSLATVADFYSAAGLESQYTDRNYGWESLDRASVRPVRGGFIIEMPKPVLLDN